jgi:IclR family pca regulon transcriptional regulator
MGRILLSDLSDDDIMCYLIRAEIRKYTTKTITNIDELLQTIKDVRADGFSVVDQELEFGLRSIAAPVLNSRRKIVAAINVGTHADRVDRIELRSTILPRLRQATQSLSQCGVWAA